MTSKITRHFITLKGRWGTRQVHYRRTGSGPLLLMLHQSPQSSRELGPLMESWSDFFTIVAPDSPGYGLSDPLCVDEAELSDFAGATMEFMDAIGAARFGVYGFHTGGMIGIAIAHGYPDRATCFACNGISVSTEDELKDILAVYLPRLEPRWDGGHLAWLWGKTREQIIFFPWHERTLAARMDFPMPSPEHQQNSVREFLRAGDHYHVAYRAAFVFHAERVVPELKVPGLITAADWDPLQSHLSRLSDAPDCVQIIKSDTLARATQRCLDRVRSYPGEPLSAAPASGPVPNRFWSQLVETAGGAVLVKRGGQGSAAPVVLLHGAGGSSATVAFIAESLAQTRSVVVIDLPGHGESDYDPGPDDFTIKVCAEAVFAVLNNLNLQVVDLVGVDGGAFVALEMAGRNAGRIGRLALVHPPEVTREQAHEWRESGMPLLVPDWAGGHLLRCWHMVRDSRLYFPWFQRDRAGIRWQEPDLDDRRIQLEVTEYLKAEGAWQQMLDDQLDYPLQEKLKACGNKVTLCASPHSPWFAITEHAATRATLPFLNLNGDRESWGSRLAVTLSS
jgi:pimeloyl-ACP methyl ester carboxylesterase